MPGCGGVCAAAVVAADLGLAALSVEAVLLDFAGAEELSEVTRSDCGAEGALADAAGDAPALSFSALDFLDFLLDAG